MKNLPEGTPPLEVESDMRDLFDSLNSRRMPEAAILQTKLAEYNAIVLEKCAAADAKADQALVKVEGLMKMIDIQNGRLDAHDGRLDTHDGQISELQASHAALQAQIKGLEEAQKAQPSRPGVAVKSKRVSAPLREKKTSHTTVLRDVFVYVYDKASRAYTLATEEQILTSIEKRQAGKNFFQPLKCVNNDTSLKAPRDGYNNPTGVDVWDPVFQDEWYDFFYTKSKATSWTEVDDRAR